MRSPCLRSCSCSLLAAGARRRRASATTRASSARRRRRSPKSQAAELTLTLTDGAVRPDSDLGPHGRHHRRRAARCSRRRARRAEAALVKVGQRVRAFPPESRSSMYQARVTRVVARGGDASRRRRRCRAGARREQPRYVLEIVDERGRVPVGAERGDHRRRRHGTSSTCRQRTGSTCRRRFRPAFRASCYTQVLDGLKDGEQVVTFGSFFIDAEHKLKGTEPDRER